MKLAVVKFLASSFATLLLGAARLNNAMLPAKAGNSFFFRTWQATILMAFDQALMLSAIDCLLAYRTTFEGVPFGSKARDTSRLLTAVARYIHGRFTLGTASWMAQELAWLVQALAPLLLAQHAA